MRPLGTKARISRTAAIVALLFFTWLIGSRWSRHSTIESTLTSVNFPDWGPIQPVELRPGLVSDFYEHRWEHAPPHDPSGAMQKRERFYRCPAPPSDLLRSINATIENAALLPKLQGWDAALKRGEQIPPSELKTIEALAEHSGLKATLLLDVGRSVSFLYGDEFAASWFRAGLAKASTEFEDVRAGDSAAFPLVQALDQTKALWRLKDYAALEMRFAIAASLYPPLSPEARRSAYLHADMLFYRMQYAQAADEIMAVQGENQQAGDIGVLDRSDIAEMEWTQGLFSRAAGRNEEAIKHLRACIDEHGIHAEDACFECFVSLLELDQITAAEDMYRNYIRVYHPDRHRVQWMGSMLESQRASLNASH